MYLSKIKLSATRDKAENTITELLGMVRLLTRMEQETAYSICLNNPGIVTCTISDVDTYSYQLSKFSEINI